MDVMGVVLGFKEAATKYNSKIEQKNLSSRLRQRVNQGCQSASVLLFKIDVEGIYVKGCIRTFCDGITVNSYCPGTVET